MEQEEQLVSAVLHSHIRNLHPDLPSSAVTVVGPRRRKGRTSPQQVSRRHVQGHMQDIARRDHPTGDALPEQERGLSLYVRDVDESDRCGTEFDRDWVVLLDDEEDRGVS